MDFRPSDPGLWIVVGSLVATIGVQTTILVLTFCMIVL